MRRCHVFFILFFISRLSYTQKSDGILIKYQLIVDENDTTSFLNGVPDYQLPGIRAKGLSSIDRVILVEAISKWIVHHRTGINCDEYLISGGEPNLFFSPVEMPLRLPENQSREFIDLFGSTSLVHYSVNGPDEGACENIVYQDDRLMAVDYLGMQPIVIGEPECCGIYKTDSNGQIVYEPIYNITQYLDNRFTFIEKWELKKKRFEKTIYGVGIESSPLYFVESEHKRSKKVLLASNVIYNVYLKDDSTIANRSVEKFVVELVKGLRAGDYNYVIDRGRRFYPSPNCFGCNGQFATFNTIWDYEKAYNQDEYLFSSDTLLDYPSLISHLGSSYKILGLDSLGNNIYDHENPAHRTVLQLYDTTRLNTNDVAAIRFLEDWYLHEESGELHKKVKGCVLLFDNAENAVAKLTPFAPFLVYIRFD